MAEIIVRPITKADYAGVRRVDILTQQQYLGAKWESLSAAEQEAHLVSRKREFQINVDSGFSFVAAKDNQLIGFLLAYETHPFRGTIDIRHIAIAPEFQGKGIGVLLYNALIKKARFSKMKDIRALINTDNPNSMQLHHKVGFTLIDRKEAIFKLL